jgi:hypothetical protein
MPDVPIEPGVVYACSPHVESSVQSLTIRHAQAGPGLLHLFAPCADAIATVRLIGLTASAGLLYRFALPLFLAALLGLQCSLTLS